MKRFFRNLFDLALLILALALWITLPLAGIGVLIGLLAVFLALTRFGQLSLAAAKVGIANLPQRWGGASVVIIGIGGVVTVLVAMLAMAGGFAATLNSSGSEDTAIMLRGGAQVEVNSVLPRDQVALLANLDGIARDRDNRPLLSAELSQVVSLPGRGEGNSNVQLRGVSPQAWEIRPKVRITNGRKFEPGKREVVVGHGVASQYQGVEVGDTLHLGNEDWLVVGHFASGDSLDSELWTDVETLASFSRRSSYQSVTVKLQDAQALQRLQAAVADDPRLRLDVMSTRDYFSRQAGNLRLLIEIFGTVIGVIMALGAGFGALNSMYAAVATRAREIATLRAIGFSGGPVVLAVMLETLLLALAGGLLGGLLAWSIFNGYSASTMSANFSTVVFAFEVSPELLGKGLKWALGIGLVGGLFPALRAARLPITTALQAI